MHAGNFGKCLSPESNRESMPKYDQLLKYQLFYK